VSVQYEIRTMQLSEILDMGFRLLRNHFGLLIGISAVIYVPMGIFGTWMRSWMETSAAGASELDLGLAAVSVLAVVVTYSIVAPLVSAAITYALGELYLGRSVTIGAAFRASLPRLLPLVGTMFLATLAIMMGLLLFVVPGLYLMLAFSLLTQVIVLENVAGMTALSRSRELLRGNLLRAVGIILVFSIASGVLGMSLGLAFGAVPALESVGSALAQALAFAYYSAVLVVFYFEIRARKEAFDLEHLARLVETGGVASDARG
jgi:hypothetical protein